MAVTIDGRELLYAELFSAVIDSNMHDRLALNWQTPFKRSGDGVLGCPLLEKCGIGTDIHGLPWVRIA